MKIHVQYDNVMYIKVDGDSLVILQCYTCRLQSGVAPKVVKAGLRCIVSNQDAWYLDHLNVSWLKFYMNEPLTNITDTYEQSLVIGGEVCMWGETVDPSDIEQTIWPRAAAAA